LVLVVLVDQLALLLPLFLEATQFLGMLQMQSHLLVVAMVRHQVLLLLPQVLGVLVAAGR
jgi:protoporphyrinogen oxidase